MVVTLGVSDEWTLRDKSGHDRDVFNERPTREEQTVATSAASQHTGPSPLANEATIHTTLGDIHMRLFPQQAPLKHYCAHPSTIVGISTSINGQLFASVAEDGTAKVFDILNYGQHHFHRCARCTLTTCSSADMTNMIKLGFTPLACCWVHKPGTAREILAVYVTPLCALVKCQLMIFQLRSALGSYPAIRRPWRWFSDRHNLVFA